MGILTLVALSTLAVTKQVRSGAEQSVYQNTTLTMAQGYLEQLRSLDYTTLSAAAQDSASAVTIPLINAAGTAVQSEAGGNLTNGAYAREIVYLDETASHTPIQPLTFRFRAVLTSLESTTGGTASGVEVTVYYETTYNFGTTRTFSGALRTVRSGVPTY